jgi:L-asparaginase II
MKLPWQPLFTIERSGKPEVTISGIISVVDGSGRPLLSVGDVDYEVWGRSCLKPWQLLGHYQDLKTSYRELKSDHLAMMQSSHNGEAFHLQRLREIMTIGQVDPSMLKCPAWHSGDAFTRMDQIRAGEAPSSLYNGCSGKHFGLLMAMNLKGLDVGNYTNPSGEQFVRMRQLLAWLLNRPSNQFATTIDGCRLPNYALSVRELALLYCGLLQGVSVPDQQAAPKELRDALKSLPEVGMLMRQFPELIGGSERLDTRIMTGALTDDKEIAVVAKEGAEGLLSVGIGSCKDYPKGLGIVIKLGSGFDTLRFETVIKYLLERLGLRTPENFVDLAFTHIKTKYHFEVLQRLTV